MTRKPGIEIKPKYKTHSTNVEKLVKAKPQFPKVALPKSKLVVRKGMDIHARKPLMPRPRVASVRP